MLRKENSIIDSVLLFALSTVVFTGIIYLSMAGFTLIINLTLLVDYRIHYLMVGSSTLAGTAISVFLKFSD